MNQNEHHYGLQITKGSHLKTNGQFKLQHLQSKTTPVSPREPSINKYSKPSKILRRSNAHSTIDKPINGVWAFTTQEYLDSCDVIVQPRKGIEHNEIVTPFQICSSNIFDNNRYSAWVNRINRNKRTKVDKYNH